MFQAAHASDKNLVRLKISKVCCFGFFVVVVVMAKLEV